MLILFAVVRNAGIKPVSEPRSTPSDEGRCLPVLSTRKTLDSHDGLCYNGALKDHLRRPLKSEKFENRLLGPESMRTISSARGSAYDVGIQPHVEWPGYRAGLSF